jgi:hypothetical protein
MPLANSLLQIVLFYELAILIGPRLTFYLIYNYKHGVCAYVCPFLPFRSYLLLPNLPKLLFIECQGGASSEGNGRGGTSEEATGDGGTDEEGSGYWELFGNIREHKTYQGRWRRKT